MIGPGSDKKYTSPYQKKYSSSGPFFLFLLQNFSNKYTPIGFPEHGGFEFGLLAPIQLSDKDFKQLDQHSSLLFDWTWHVAFQTQVVDFPTQLTIDIWSCQLVQDKYLWEIWEKTAGKSAIIQQDKP